MTTRFDPPKTPTTTSNTSWTATPESTTDSVLRSTVRFPTVNSQCDNMLSGVNFSDALENIIHERLESHGLVKTPLPLGTPFSQTHVPIFVDASLETKSRVVVVFGEASKFLGLLAGRVATGRGGVNKGSMVSVVEELHRQRSSPDDRGPPGVVLANIGELYWWPEGKRSLTLGDSSAIPLPSLVHRGWNFMPGINYIRGNETPERHVQCVFDQTLQNLVNEKALLDVVAIGDTCGIVERFLDEENNWNAWGHRLSSILLMDPFRDVEKLSNPSIKEFLAKVRTSPAEIHASLTRQALPLLLTFL